MAGIGNTMHTLKKWSVHQDDQGWLFLLALTQYVDDFPQLEPEASMDSATVAEEVPGEPA